MLNDVNDVNYVNYVNMIYYLFILIVVQTVILGIVYYLHNTYQILYLLLLSYPVFLSIICKIMK
ncbi:hypothetical protein C1645_760440 [Glomus cerebriforme]|uniref:Uncharacterized protein n=1 Tax=Glomus cerebriforme TaxID=658196 RepID=A0A397TGZ6_9GLOM|nr:hypothetical protein C1645_760440 [Glomus cerebriforme]